MDLLRLIKSQYQVFPSGLKLAIRYSDEQGYVTDRVIAPVRYFEAYDGREFLRAWCYLRNAERTFRMDRITTARVVDGMTTAGPAEPATTQRAASGRVGSTARPATHRSPNRQRLAGTVPTARSLLPGGRRPLTRGRRPLTRGRHRKRSKGTGMYCSRLPARRSSSWRCAGISRKSNRTPTLHLQRFTPSLQGCGPRRHRCLRR